MNEEIKSVMITETRLKELLKMECELDYLYAKGIDNWEGYIFNDAFEMDIQKINNTDYREKEFRK